MGGLTRFRLISRVLQPRGTPCRCHCPKDIITNWSGIVLAKCFRFLYGMSDNVEKDPLVFGSFPACFQLTWNKSPSQYPRCLETLSRIHINMRMLPATLFSLQRQVIFLISCGCADTLNCLPRCFSRGCCRHLNVRGGWEHYQEAGLVQCWRNGSLSSTLETE